MKLWLPLVVLALAAVGGTVVALGIGSSEPLGPVGAAGEQCDLIASPDGDDDASGALDNPLATADELADQLSEGEVGCLREGTYTFEELALREPNRTLAGYPGERARLVGRITVDEDAVATKVRNLTLLGDTEDGIPSPVINADSALFERVDVSNEGGICFNIGHPSYGEPEGVVIRDSVIHDCGRTPSTNKDHGVYIAHATGTRVIDNEIRDNVDRGIQLYPNADESLIEGNLVVGNGQGIIISGGSEGADSSDNLIRWNVIADSTLRMNVESNWPDEVGEGNVVRENCVFGVDENGGIQDPPEGFRAEGNIVTPPDECPFPVGPAASDLNRDE